MISLDSSYVFSVDASRAKPKCGQRSSLVNEILETLLRVCQFFIPRDIITYTKQG